MGLSQSYVGKPSHRGYCGESKSNSEGTSNSQAKQLPLKRTSPRKSLRINANYMLLACKRARSGCGLSASFRVRAHSVEQWKEVQGGNAIPSERAFFPDPEELICPCLGFPPSLRCVRMRRENGISEMCIGLLTFGFGELWMGSNSDYESGIGTPGRHALAAN